MSIHRSLFVRTKLQRSRNVLSRWERIEKLRSQDKFPDKKSVFGLPKVASGVKVKKKKKE